MRQHSNPCDGNIVCLMTDFRTFPELPSVHSRKNRLFTATEHIHCNFVVLNLFVGSSRPDNHEQILSISAGHRCNPLQFFIINTKIQMDRVVKYFTFNIHCTLLDEDCTLRGVSNLISSTTSGGIIGGNASIAGNRGLGITLAKGIIIGNDSQADARSGTSYNIRDEASNNPQKPPIPMNHLGELQSR